MSEDSTIEICNRVKRYWPNWREWFKDCEILVYFLDAVGKTEEEAGGRK